MLCNEAAVLSTRRGSKLVTAADFESARDKVLMGLESKNKTTDQAERKLTAYHEAGHALLACANPHSDPVHQTTIMQRGTALGMMMRLPEKEKLSVTLAQLKADLDVVMAGRAAEEIVFGKEYVTSGAMSDIERATDIATNMVVNWGMSEVVGMRKIAQSPLGYGDLVDREIKAVLDSAYLRAIDTLTKQRVALDAIAEALLERETLSGKEVRAIYKANTEPLAA
jgi:cell division protease FtsH